MKKNGFRVGVYTAAVFIVIAAAFFVSWYMSDKSVDEVRTGDLEKVVLQLKWVHQGQFAGFYVAEQMGFYEDEGIDIEIVPGGPGVDGVDELVSGRAHFSILSGDQLIAERAGGDPIKAVSVIYQQTPIVFMALPDSGIVRPQDFVGKTVSVNRGRDTQILLRMMLKSVGVDPSGVRETEIDPALGISGLLKGDVDVRGTYSINEVMKARLAGIDANVISPEEYGVRFYGDIIVSTDELAGTDPGLVTRFLKASLRGWLQVLQNPHYAASATMKYDAGLDREEQEAMVLASLPLVYDGKSNVGGMDNDVWRDMIALLFDMGIIEAMPSVDEVMDSTFVDELINTGEL